jgi:outer membrane receptor protein involved in Fe transport
VNTSIPFNTGNTDGIPNAVLTRNGRFSTFTAGGVLFPATGAFNLADGRIRGFGTAQTNYFQFGADGSIIPFNPGTNFGNSNSSGGDGFDLVQTAQLTADLNRFTANLSARYELTDGITAFFEGNYYKADALELIDQSIYNANLFGGLSAPITIQSAYPLLSPSARSTLTTNGITSFRISRASRDLVNNNASAENVIWRGVAGLEGEFEVFNRKWNWQASANYGTTRLNFEQSVLNQQNFVNAVNVTTNTQGQVVCAGANVTTITVPTAIDPETLPAARRTDKVNGSRFNAAFPTGQNYTARPDPACVPLNIFGEGAPSQAAKDYVTGLALTSAELKQRVYNANFGGDLFSLLADPIAFNVGYEHRDEEGGFVPNEFQQIGRGRAVAILPNSGKFNTDEVFGEVVLPLLNADNNIPLINTLEAIGKIRYVDNTVNGGFTSYTYGGRFKPISDIEFRGNFTRSFRAPAITELFTSQSDIFTTVPDPCDSRNVSGGTKPAIRAANCAAFYTAFGITSPASFQSNAVGATVRGTTSGDGNLKNEKADSWTMGAVLRPRFIPNLRIAIDYYDIRINGVITNLGAAALSTGCFDNINFNTADVQNANQFCSRLQRLPNGQINPDGGVRTGFVNGDYRAFRGWSVEANYKFDLADIGLENAGKLDLQGSIFRTLMLEESANGVAVDFIDQEIGTPEWAGQFNIGYTRGGFGFDFQGNFQSSVLFDRDFTAETRDILVLDRYWSFNSSVSYKFKENSLVRLSVTNLFDADPPFPLAGAALGVYDTLGRRFSVAMQLRF